MKKNVIFIGYTYYDDGRIEIMSESYPSKICFILMIDLEKNGIIKKGKRKGEEKNRSRY